MMYLKKSFIGILILISSLQAYSQHAFQFIVLGSGGGVDESNLSSYLIAPAGSENFVALDAGSLMSGLKLLAGKDYDSETSIHSPDAFLLKSRIKAYVISHAHFDHIAGLIQASPFDTQKVIYCTEQTRNTLVKYVFNNGIWANFTDYGENQIGNYSFVITPEKQWVSLAEPKLELKAFHLSHLGSGNSTAFLIRNVSDYIIYFGDTGADSVEKSNSLAIVWNEISPLIRSNQLKALVIECSFNNSVPDNLLFGHLNPRHLGMELKSLASLINSDNETNALQGLKVIITHIKPGFLKNVNDQEIILNQLKEFSYLGAEFIIAEQAKKYLF